MKKHLYVITNIFSFLSKLFCKRSNKATTITNEQPNTNLEICIVCGKATDIPSSMPIQCRKNYVSGAGQLCEKCQRKLNYELQKN